MKRRYTILTLLVLPLLGAPALVAQEAQQQVRIGGNIYGGGNMSKVNSCTHVTINNVLMSDTSDIYGGGQGLFKDTDPRTLEYGRIDDTTYVDINNALWTAGDAFQGHVYGGGALGQAQNTFVNLKRGVFAKSVYGGSKGDTINERLAATQTTKLLVSQEVSVDTLFGGGEQAMVVDSTLVTVNGAHVAAGLYGGSNVKGDIGKKAQLVINGGQIGTVYGGGFGAATNVVGSVHVLMNDGTVLGDLYGGSRQGKTNTKAEGDSSTYVSITGGKIQGTIYGGGHGEDGQDANVGGKVYLTMSGGQANTIYGCNNVKGAPQNTVFLKITGGEVIADVFGGGNLADYDYMPFVTMTGGHVGHNVYGGGNVADVHATRLHIAGGIIDNNVYGGGKMADIGDSTHVTMSGGKAAKLFGGNDISGVISDATHVYITNSGTLDSERLQNLKKSNSVYTVRPEIGEVYAGGDGAQTPAGTHVPDVRFAHLSLLGGAIGNAYGGGNAATVTVATTIHTDTKNQVFEYEKENYKDTIFDANRLFGGNNLAPMSIQPTWELISGHFGSVYSGGNKGNMTYYNAEAGTSGHEDEVKGLRIDVTSPTMYIDRLFGGCRMSDVNAGTTFAGNDNEDRYGANVFVSAGHIESVYGGNDVSGMVYNGTRLDIKGAISGDIYGGGNGNYIYKYEHNTVDKDTIIEVEENGENYFIVKTRSSLPAATTELAKIDSINAFRPNVPRAYLDIAGTEKGGVIDTVFIKGDVYTGGNSASVSGKDGENVDVLFEVGSHVIINGVYMGCNGSNLKDSVYLNQLFAINNIDFDGSGNQEELLAHVMQAVEMNALPKGFNGFGNSSIENAHIGVFCMGGNAGSLTSNKHLTMGFPEGLNIFNRIVGGCNNTDFIYHNVKHKGGLITPLAGDQGETKVTLDVACSFTPQVIELHKNEYGYEDKASLVYHLTKAGVKKDKVVFKERRCNIYGGCFESGTTLGGIEINIKTDMLKNFVGQQVTAPGICTNLEGETILKNTNDLKYSAVRSSAEDSYVFSVFGGGYGQNSHVLGDVHIKMPMDRIDNDNTKFYRTNTIYGGSEEGRVVGNVLVEVRNGEIYNSIFGGSDAAKLYGSTQIIVGYPDYYTGKENHLYTLDRSDKSPENRKRWSPERPNVKVLQDTAYYQKGEIIPCNVAEFIDPVKDPDAITYMDVLVDEKPRNMAGDDVNWNGIGINIRSGIYGGGYSASYNSQKSSGIYTICPFDAENCPLDVHNGYPLSDYVNYGGNSTILVEDDTDKSRIRISTPPTSGNLRDPMIAGEGGIFGCGHLTFTSGFRAVDLKNYGYADYTVEKPLCLNTFQRIDLLTVRDCCMQIWGSRDFATNTANAEIYSFSRVHEINMQSSIDANSNLADYAEKKSRNYIGFMRNMHYFGSLVANDSFESGVYHDSLGVKQDAYTYEAFKRDTISAYRLNNTSDEDVTRFKRRNVGTARNLIGINNGYVLHITNACQKYLNPFKDDYTSLADSLDRYYGPILGVAEVKLLSFIPGEGGGYVFADNIHDYSATGGGIDDRDNEFFRQRQGNFVFPGVQGEAEGSRQYIVDDCAPVNYSRHTVEPEGFRELLHAHEAEQHYWYVQGTKYFFNTTLTGYTSNAALHFYSNNDNAQVQISGLQNGNPVVLESVDWVCDTIPSYKEPGEWLGDYDVNYHRDLKDPTKNYTFDIEIGQGSNLKVIPNMPRETFNHVWEIDSIVGHPNDTITKEALEAIRDAYKDNPENQELKKKIYQCNTIPTFVLHLKDSTDNYGKPSKPDNYGINYYRKNLEKPEQILITMKALDEEGQLCTYYITAIVKYLVGPYIEGQAVIENCALPGEYIKVNADFFIGGDGDLSIADKTWKLLKRKDDGTYESPEKNNANVITIPQDYIRRITESNGREKEYLFLPARFYQNDFKLAYTFKAVGSNFGFTSELGTNTMLEVHNYHKMSRAAELAADSCAGSRIYIEDAEDLAAFQTWVNNGKRTEDLHFILQANLDLPADWTLTKPFKGTFHGDGYTLVDASNTKTTLFGNKVDGGKIYNLGFVGTQVESVAESDTINCYVYQCNPEMGEFKYGKKAYELSHRFQPGTAYQADGYVEQYYANGDYQYATCDTLWSLRKGKPILDKTVDWAWNNGNTLPVDQLTNHDMKHTHDALRWRQISERRFTDIHGNDSIVGDSVNVPLHCGLVNPYYNDYLFFGQRLDTTALADSYPTHINSKVGNYGNRVYETAGFYRNSKDQKFYYNPEAWALQDSLTAISFVEAVRTVESDTAGTAPKAFDSDSNADYGSQYSNDTEGHVTQNLLVYHNGESFFLTEGEFVPESEVRYHAINKGTIANLHLVDKQDFNAPIAFNVSNRIWYEREPLYYRNVNQRGWEGICLPFTSTRDSASVNGQVSHFYGGSELNHEYWLRGMTGTEGDKLTFLSVGTDTENSFADSRQTTINMAYKNTYFANDLGLAYDKRENFGQHYANAAKGAGILYENYVPLSASVPYLMALPGNSYYEFSMEGSEYSNRTHFKSGDAQYITFENRPGATPLVIQVSDDENRSSVAGDYKHQGTYQHVTSTYHLDNEGNGFQAGSGTVLPFRTYLESSAPAAPYRIAIVGAQEAIEETEPEDPAAALEIYVKGMTVYVSSPYEHDLHLPVYMSSGHLVTVHKATTGVSSFRLGHAGVYVIGENKILVK